LTALSKSYSVIKQEAADAADKMKGTIMELTISDIKELLGGAPEATSDPSDPPIGSNVIIRTVTHTYTGCVVAVGPTWIRLNSAAWVAESGRWGAALASGSLSEVEFMGDNVRVARAAVVDISPWKHPLPAATV
jgi:hypothetical protein